LGEVNFLYFDRSPGVANLRFVCRDFFRSQQIGVENFLLPLPAF
jgi:hypothetical protein